MRILFVATSLDKPEAYLIRALRERGHEIRLLISDRPGVLETFGSDRNFIEFMPLNSRVSPHSIIKIRRTLRFFNPAIVHSLSARALSNSLFATVGNHVRHVAYRGTMGNLSYWDPSSLISFLHPRLSKIICVSEAVRADLERLGVAPNKLVRIYKGHDPAWYAGIQALDRASYGVPPGQFLIGCVANSRPVKGVDTLLKAFLKLAPEMAAHLVVVGEIRDPKLNALAQRDNRIHLLGFRNDAPAIVAGCDLFCMPSRRREGFPKALIEAMIQGIPAVVTSVGGLPEMVIDRVNGLVVPPDDPEALASALREFIETPGLAMSYGPKARTRVCSEFPIEMTVRETEAVYRELTT